jgi:phosphopantothenoylcysteine decarboxylase/phosphopantothenate--cysteine ligase
MGKMNRPKRVVLGVTGSIACYKAAEIARLFVKRGLAVRVVMTESAKHFVTPLTFQALTGNPVNDSFWSEGAPDTIGHIELADWADVVVVAPATADSIAKMSLGFAESSLLAVVLATKAPVVVAPAMNVNMLEHPQTQEHIGVLARRGVCVVAPEVGALACGWTGSGRLASPEEIVAQTERVLGPGDLIGKRVVVSAGPTREAIDPVRFLSNRSSGRMGVALAKEAYRRGAEVTLVHGPLSYSPLLPAAIARRSVTSADEMYRAVFDEVYGGGETPRADVVVMAAAVADFKSAAVATHKLKKAGGAPEVALAPNQDILAELGARRLQEPKPMLVGFAVETGDAEELVAEARSKLERKNVDIVVGNLGSEAFEGSTNRVWVVCKDGRTEELAKSSKRSTARGVWQVIADLM